MKKREKAANAKSAAARGKARQKPPSKRAARAEDGPKRRAASKPQAAKKPKSSSRTKVAAYRARMKAAGMRLLQIWVPDTASPRFRAEARRQSERIAASRHAAADQAWIDAVSEPWPA